MSNNRAIVIGSGFGGLAAAIRLRARGWSVEVLEAVEQPGGRAAVFEVDGFSFDAGPTVVTAPYLLDELFELVGRRASDYFELMPVDPFYRVCFHDGGVFDYVGDEDRLLEQIRRFNPDDVDGYRRFARHVKEIFEIGYLELADSPFERLSDMFRVAPDMIRLQNYRSVYGLVSKYIKDERLRQVFSFQPLLVGGNPFDTSSIYTLIHWLEREWGVHFARGGTTAIVGGLVKLLDELDVPIRLNSPVTEILVNDEGRATGVVVSGSEVIDADLIVSNGDPTWIYENLVDARHRKKYSDRKIGRKKQSMSLFVAYFGTTKTYPDLAHHSIILGPRYRELLRDIFDRKVLAEDFSLYLHAPTRSDPSLAPDGCECFYVLSPVPNQASGLDWSEIGEKYLAKILDFLDEHHLPGLKEHLATSFFVDPRYFEGKLRSAEGAAFSIQPILRQSAYFRYHNKSDDVDGLYMVGAGTHPGAGMPGVFCSAKVLEHVLPGLPAAAQSPLPSRGAKPMAAE